MGKIVVWVVALGVVVTGTSQHADAAVVINEVLADPAGDANHDGSVHATRDEFVELTNTDSAVVSLASWTLSDSIQVRHLFADAALIPGRGFFVIFGGGAPEGFANGALASSGGLGLNNPGDTVTLRDAQAAVIDSLTYGAEGGMDVSLTRSPDATGPFVAHSSVTNMPFSPAQSLEGLFSLPALDQPEPTDFVEPSGPEPSPSNMPELLELERQESHSGPVVPEPSSLFLLGTGLLGLGGIIRRRDEETAGRPSERLSPRGDRGGDFPYHV